jgi:hypothetical protein
MVIAPVTISSDDRQHLFLTFKFLLMKKVLLLMAICGLFATAGFAQEKKHDPAEWDKKVKTELALTEEQTVKYDALSKEFQDKFDGLAKDATLTKEAQKEKKMALKKEKEAKLFEFLTPDQQTKYKEMIEKKKAEKPSGS